MCGNNRAAQMRARATLAGVPWVLYQHLPGWLPSPKVEHGGMRHKLHGTCLNISKNLKARDGGIAVVDFEPAGGSGVLHVALVHGGLCCMHICCIVMV